MKNMNNFYVALDPDALHLIVSDDKSFMSIGNGRDTICRSYDELKLMTERDFRDLDSVNLKFDIISYDQSREICWFTEKAISEQIEDMIIKFAISLDLVSKVNSSKIKEYLMNAKMVAAEEST